MQHNMVSFGATIKQFLFLYKPAKQQEVSPVTSSVYMFFRRVVQPVFLRLPVLP